MVAIAYFIVRLGLAVISRQSDSLPLSMATYLITGTARGIGFELTKQLLDLPESRAERIIALVRHASGSLRHLSSESSNRLEIIEVEDITDNAISGAVKHVEATLGDRGLDVLINVVGSNQPVTSDGLRTLKSTDLLTAFNTNVLTTRVMISHMLPLLKKGEAKKIINISTSLGSIAYARQTSFAPVHAYKISKAALNMLTAQYAVDLEKDGFCVLAVSPGWLRTDLGGKDSAHLDVSTGVAALKDVILSADVKANGKFLNIKVPGWEGTYDGEEIPW